MRLYLVLFLALLVVSCAQKKLVQAPVKNPNRAEDSLAEGNIQATAVKKINKRDVCFDITLIIKNVEQRIASPSNWTLAWTDQVQRYHLLKLKQRDPASVPQGSEKKWTNTFRTCAYRPNMAEVKSLVLTPKELPYRESEGLVLKWD